MSDESPYAGRPIRQVKWPIVVVVILFFLLLAPQIRDGRQKDRRTLCLNNVKQIGLAFAQYAIDYQDRLPMDSSNPTLAGSLMMLSNLVSTKTLICPSDKHRGVCAAASWSQVTTKNISYSYVPNLMWQETNSDKIVLLDRIYTTKKGDKWPADGNHGSTGGNVLFADGHVEFCQELPADLKDKGGVARVLSP